MLAFSFPTMIQGRLLPDLGLLCWISLVPLFFAIRDARPLRAFLYSFAMGVVCYSITIWWIYRALKVYGGITTSLSIFITALLIFMVSAFAGLACSIAVWLHRKSRAEFILLISVSWVVVEYLRHYIPFGGFPWANLAMSQTSYLPVIQIVDLVGLFGVIFLIVWVNYFIVELILKLRHEYVSLFWAKMAITLVLLISTIAYGYIRIDQFQGGFDSDGITVGVIQGNVAQEDKWNRDKAENNLSFYRESAKQLSLVPVDLIVWPEAAFPYLIKMPFYAIDPAKLGVVPTLGSPLPYTLLGAVTENVNRRFGNSALLFDSKGMLQDVFNKAHLVPFGEYVPLRKLFFFVDKITTFPSDDMVAGTSFEPFNLGNHKISMLICY
ncbi:MAG: apolipoprotein N-acyltransferase, partial [archaeon]